MNSTSRQNIVVVWLPRCDADPAQQSSGNRGRHDVRGPSACVLRRAAALSQLGLQRDLRDARQRLRDGAVTLHRVRDLLELRLVDAGHRGVCTENLNPHIMVM